VSGQVGLIQTGDKSLCAASKIRPTSACSGAVKSKVFSMRFSGSSDFWCMSAVDSEAVRSLRLNGVLQLLMELGWLLQGENIAISCAQFGLMRDSAGQFLGQTLRRNWFHAS
jgi:hypothetical protein